MGTARLGERSGGMPACWGCVQGMLLPGCLWPRAVTVMDAIAWAGRQHVPHGLNPSPLHKTEQGSGKPQTSLLAAPALFLHAASPPQRKRWDHSFCLFLSGMISVWVTCGTIWTLFLWKRHPTSSCTAQHISDAASGIGQGTFLTEAFKGKAWACSNFANGSRLRAGCNEQKRVGMLRIHFPHSWCPLSARKVFASEPTGKAAGAVSYLLEILAVAQREILIHWSLVSQ